MNKKINIGGQAVIEGVMIRGPKYYTVSVRKKKKIITKKEKIKVRKGKFFKLPVVRGFFNLVDMLKLGISSLTWSMDQQLEAENMEKLSKTAMASTIAFTVAIGLLFFVALPYFLTLIIGFKEETSPFLFNFVDGLIRISIFLGYIISISFIKDIKVLFQYHGAEHMAVHCYENNKRLNVGNIKKFPTMHPRCGTSFIFIVLLSSILVFSILPPVVFYLFPNFIHINLILRKFILFLLRISLLPLIAGLSYELLKLSDKFKDNIFMNLLIQPGLLIQKITTKKPTKKQIEVAMESVKSLLSMEQKNSN